MKPYMLDNASASEYERLDLISGSWTFERVSDCAGRR